MLQMSTVGAYAIEPVERERPLPQTGQVLLKVARVCICGSDTQVYHGLHKYAVFPLVQGHEAAFYVEKNGDGVTNVKPGDKVVCFPQFFCGTCHACRKGATNVCENQSYIGIHKDGFFAEYFLADAAKLLKLPDDMGMDTGALVEPVSVGVAAAERIDAKPEDRIAVIGAGPIGNLVAQACRAAGAEVLVCDLEQSKLDFAKSKGIPHIVNTGKLPLAEAIMSSFGEKADVIIDCVGIPATLNQAIAASANSSTILVVGNFKQPFELEVPLLQRRDVELKGLFLYKIEAFTKAIALLQSGRINLDGMVTEHFPLGDLKQAFKRIDHDPGSVMKIMIDVC